VGTPELEALKTVLVSNSRYAGWCTFAVFVGLLVEYTILLWLKRQELSRWEKVLTVIAGLAIAGGVYGEYLFGSRASDAALKLESLSEQNVAALNKEAGEARKAAGIAEQKAGEANDRASANEKEAARLRKIAEDEKTARSKIVAALKQYSLSDDDQKNISDKCRQFAKPSVRVLVITGNTNRLGFQVWLALKNGGFNPDLRLTSEVWYGVSLAGPTKDTEAWTCIAEAIGKKVGLMGIIGILPPEFSDHDQCWGKTTW
jgi:hypothetical protein